MFNNTFQEKYFFQEGENIISRMFQLIDLCIKYSLSFEYLTEEKSKIRWNHGKHRSIEMS